MKYGTSYFSRILILFAAVILFGGSAVVNAQLAGLGVGVLSEVFKNKTPNLLGGKPPITTSVRDAKWGDAAKDGFTPRETKRSLLTLERTSNGGFVLQPGYYEFVGQSYCLKAGTYGPGGGDGYLYARPRGPAEGAVMAIVRKSVDHPEISQQDIQVLLWAIIARAKFEDLQPGMMVTALKLLSAKQLAMLNRSALSVVSSNALTQLLPGVPAPLRPIAQAEAQLRQLMATGATFAEMERIAVLTGFAPLGHGSQDVPSGRWSFHPDGYYIRYMPTGYNITQIEIWVPEGSRAIGKEYDPATHIAVPGNSERQRLIQSGRVYRNP